MTYTSDFSPTQPITCQNSEYINMEKYSNITISNSVVYKIDNANIIGPYAITYTDDHYLIEDTLGHENLLFDSAIYTIQSGMLPINIESKTDLRLESAVSLAGIWSHSYYHWFIDYLPRIMILESLSEDIEKTKIIISKNPPEWLESSLRLLGYSKDNLFEISKDRIKIDTLFLSAIPREDRVASHGRNTWYAPEPYKMIADKLIQKVDNSVSGSKRIYISRADADNRRVMNRPEVMKLLSQYGFKSYELSRLTLSEQVELFSNAEFIVGPHGLRI
jgi:capsular polysaccharide biosynthesis protein